MPAIGRICRIGGLLAIAILAIHRRDIEYVVRNGNRQKSRLDRFPSFQYLRNGGKLSQRLCQLLGVRFSSSAPQLATDLTDATDSVNNGNHPSGIAIEPRLSTVAIELGMTATADRPAGEEYSVESRGMHTCAHNGMTHRILSAFAVVFCLGCGMPRPRPQPIFQPLPQPIWQPISQPMPRPLPPPIIQPISQPISQPTSGIFALSGSASQQSTVKAALARCSFPFDRLKPGLQRQGIASVKISWRAMGDGGLGWASTGGEVAINNSISGLQAQRTAILELGHEVDFFYMTPEMRKAVIKLWHPDILDNDEWFGSTAYWSQIGEAYSTLFLWAFTDEEMWFDAGYSHKPSKALASQLRAILLPETAMR